MDVSVDIAALETITMKLLDGCRIEAEDGTNLYVPDGRGDYQALWTRDFTYMVENAGHLIPTADVEEGIRFLLDAQRADGAIPDRVQPDGHPVYAAGIEDAPLGRPNLDNSQFAVVLVDEFLSGLNDPERARQTFEEWADTLATGMDYVPRSDVGLVYNDPDDPHSPYGFHDTVAKTGELFFESVLYWTAARRLARWSRRIDNDERASDYQRRADQIEEHFDALWDEQVGAFLAASVDCQQIDVWGNAYAVASGVPLGDRRDTVVRWLADNYDRYVRRGQVRHLPEGEYWEQFLREPVTRDTYQNGAYWATASGWVIEALADAYPDLSQQTLTDLVTDFETNGVYECIEAEKLESYVVSACNPLGAARRRWSETSGVQ